ncbi:unnamed protein product [Clonostachys rosea f. rosea IK726]|uniref:Uncharacterized protein n=1 Tax=Clonostachys rosea f. rosea IK726 TaxID=1349383 RepID=A0ACA9UEY7_BIOOC|nr:unnamed protein product [Clonostachys rosea f. rosea IK726]
MATTLFAGSYAVGREEGKTAESKYNWVNQTQGDHFDNVTLSKRWNAYDGLGHVGNAVRSPGAISIKNSILTITGTPDGVTGSMSWTNGQLYGCWETRARYKSGTPAYHCVIILWPDALDWPEGGEIDFSEVGNGARQTLHFFLHYGKDNKQHHNSTKNGRNRMCWGSLTARSNGERGQERWKSIGLDNIACKGRFIMGY